MKVAYIGGFWATNIGNSFYDIGILWLLKKVYGEKNVYFINDIAQWYWNVNNNFDPLLYIDVDLCLWSGPIFNDYIQKYESIFDTLFRKNIKIGFISAGASQYTTDERNRVISFLKKYKKNIAYISTRDNSTYALYKDMGFNIHNGLCGSMFINNAISPVKLDIPPYVVYCFSYFKEPNLKIENNKILIDKKIFFRDKSLGDYNIIRTNHSPFSSFKYLIYNRDNMYYSDIPYGYLSIYKNASYVFSDRVHACAVSLILGSKVMYIKGTKRSRDGRNKLFSRINAEEIFNKPTSIDYAYVESEKIKMYDFLLKNK